MKETHQVEVKEEDPNASKSTTLNLSERPPLVTQPKSETIEIKPKIQPSKFETLLVGAFKKLVGYNEPKNEQNNQNETEINKINACEEELRKALEEVKLSQNIYVNKSIIDKCSRIIKKNKINLSLIIGQIYIELMNKKIQIQKHLLKIKKNFHLQNQKN